MNCPDCGEPQSGCLHTAVECRDILKRKLASAQYQISELDTLGDNYDRLVEAVIGEPASGAFCFDGAEFEEAARTARERLARATRLLRSALDVRCGGPPSGLFGEIQRFLDGAGPYKKNRDADGFGICEFCGSRTNAELRRCCSSGSHADGGRWYCKACKHVHAPKHQQGTCSDCKCPEVMP